MANQIARALRKRPTLAEAKLWRELRQLRRQGYHFRRQAPLEDYIVDFVCFGQRLVIEVDGIQHDTADGRAADAARDAKLRANGFDVLRFRNSDVRDNCAGVMETVIAALGAAVKIE